MRYIADESGCLKEVSFGAIIACGGQDCTAYTGDVPDGYSSLADWYMQECDKLYRWKIVDGNLVLDESAAAPNREWDNPPLLVGVEYRTTKRYNGKPVYTQAVDFGTMPNADDASITSLVPNRESVISAHGVMTRPGTGQVRAFPYSTTNSTWGSVDLMAQTSGEASIAINICTSHDASNFKAVVILEYTKTTD